MATLRTLGVDGRSEQQILNLVRTYSIHRVVDVRELPLTQEGLPKWPTGAALRELGVQYENRRELAPSEELRRMLLPQEDEEGHERPPDLEAFAEAYKEAAPAKAVRQVAADATLAPTLLISNSRDPAKGPRKALCELMEPYDVTALHIV